MHPVLRRSASIWALLFAAHFAYVALRAPMIETAAPAIITVALGVVAFFLWPRGEAATDSPQELVHAHVERPREPW